MCAGKSPVPGELPAQRPVTQSFDVFFDLRLNKRLVKQSWGWWFETLSHPLWRLCILDIYVCCLRRHRSWYLILMACLFNKQHIHIPLILGWWSYWKIYHYRGTSQNIRAIYDCDPIMIVKMNLVSRNVQTLYEKCPSFPQPCYERDNFTVVE